MAAASTRHLAETLPSAPPAGPTNTVAPQVTGTATQGQTLACTTGTWT